MHFNSTCSLKDFSVQPIEIISGDGRSEKSTKQRKLREAYWIKELRTIYPYGLNDRCNGQDWSNRDDDSIASTIFNKTRILERSVVIRRSISGVEIGNMKNFFRK